MVISDSSSNFKRSALRFNEEKEREKKTHGRLPNEQIISFGGLEIDRNKLRREKLF